MQPDRQEAAFSKYTREHELGTPQTDEFDFSYKGVNHRGQGFSQRFVYAKVGDWANIKEVTW